jgi:molybdopterin-guanine dinucleotide biosynthesis protein A
MNCYLLVGGSSRRMGQSKADMQFAGSTFLSRVAEAARGAFDKVIAVQRSDGEPASAVETIFETPHADQAPIFGLARALQHARGKCFVLAVDYPLITTEILRFLSERFTRSHAPLLAPRWNGKLQMLCGGYAPVLVTLIDERIAAGRFELRGLTADAEIIEEEELRSRFPGEPLMNVNTPEELAMAARWS